MKNISDFAMSRIGLVSSFSLFVIILSISFINISDETVRYKSFNSSISIANESSIPIEKTETNVINCYASFTLDEGKFVDVSEFNFDVPLDQFDQANPEMESAMQTLFKANDVTQITFIQEKAMILPAMKMIHLIGVLSIADVERPIAFQFNYVINKDRSISIAGKQTINLTDFDIKIPIHLKDAVSNEISMKLNLKMVDEELIVSKSKFVVNYE